MKKPHPVYDYALGKDREVRNNRLNRLLSALFACNPARLYADGKNFQQMWEQTDRNDWRRWLVLNLSYELNIVGGNKKLADQLTIFMQRDSFYVNNSSPILSKAELRIVHKAMLAVEKMKGTRNA